MFRDISCNHVTAQAGPYVRHDDGNELLECAYQVLRNGQRARDTMPVLKNAKHERVAQGLAKGLSADKAYATAGYKPHRGNAARMSANESIKARVADLQRKQVAKTHEYAAVNFKEQMHKLMRIVDIAINDGDITNALKG